MTGLTRKLATIVALDVAGYSARTEADEARTAAEVAALRKVIEGIAAKHGGRVFNTAGDGFMLEFGSSLSAVEAAFELAATCEPKVRVGVHLGDVVVQPNGDLLGHGVNVAARLMARSDPGAALVSGAVRQTIRGPVAERLQSRGSIQLDKMAEAIEAFTLEEIMVPETGGAQAPPRKLSICVLPFANVSDDPQQEYFSDGISEDIITDLSKVSALAVVSRNSSFQYKGKHVDLPKVARELKVSHVLEGSVRKSGGRLRITAQLIDGATNEHIWAERYDRDLNDIFALQDEISEAIVKALKLKLLPEEKKAIEKRGTNSVEAYDLCQMARHILLRNGAVSPRGGEAIVRLCKGAVQLDSNYARAWGVMSLAMTFQTVVTGGLGDEALAAAERAIALDPSLPEAHAAKGRFLASRGDFKGAWPHIDEALRLDPNSLEANLVAGAVSRDEGKFAAAIGYYEKLIKIDDTNSTFFNALTIAYLNVGDIERARHYGEITLRCAQTVLIREPDNGVLMGQTAIALAILKQPERVKEVISRGLLLDPDNGNMKFSFLVANAVQRDTEGTIAILDPLLRKVPANLVHMLKVRPLLDFVRDDPRVKVMFAAAEARLAQRP